MLLILSSCNIMRGSFPRLQVLLSFLHEFGRFDWDMHGLSLQGPILLADMQSRDGAAARLLLWLYDCWLRAEHCCCMSAGKACVGCAGAAVAVHLVECLRQEAGR